MAITNTDEEFIFEKYNEGLVVAIWLEAVDGQETEVARLLERLVTPTMAEPGVRLFLPYQSKDRKTFFLFELYNDEAAWDAHQKTEHFREIIELLLPKLSKRERVPFFPFVSNER